MSHLPNMFTDYPYVYGLLLCLLPHPHAHLPMLFHTQLWILNGSGSVTTYLARTLCFLRAIILPQIILLTPGVLTSPDPTTV